MVITARWEGIAKLLLTGIAESVANVTFTVNKNCMKYLFTTLISLFFCGSLLAQNTDTTKRKIDQRLVGSWSGSDLGHQQKGVNMYWLQSRNPDGTFVSLIIAIDKKGKVENIAEKGKWWVENDVFYELHFVSGDTDTYTYEVLDEEHIKFKLKSTALNMANSNYEFVDTKVDEE
jgi:hypothetical protein